MKKEKLVSIIIRTKNEERWINACLDGVFSQDYKNIEVIIVDNKSIDKTIEKAKRYKVKIFSIDDYLPGKALNLGIRNSSGDYICCLSGHCIPTNKYWLSGLVRNIIQTNVAGVYGRQEPLSYSSDFDKRDLLITFGLDKKVQKKDPFFHNANSMILRSLWNKVPFDENITNIEDRLWASKILKLGYKIIYEPKASVYHYHGIYQDLDIERCRKVVGILENIEKKKINKKIDIKKYNTVGIIPIKGEVTKVNGYPLIEYTLQRVIQSNYISNIVVTSDNSDYSDIVSKYKEVIFIKRPEQLIKDYIEIEDVLKYSLNELEKKKIFPDIVLYLSVNYPFRSRNIIDDIIETLVRKGLDSSLPAIPEYRSCWQEKNSVLTRIDKGFIPNKYKQPIYIGISGLGTATFSSFIRNGERLGSKVGIVEIKDFISTLDIGKKENWSIAESIIEKWWKENK